MVESALEVVNEPFRLGVGVSLNSSICDRECGSKCAVSFPEHKRVRANDTEAQMKLEGVSFPAI